MPEGPSRKPAFWKSGGSTCAKSVCAASGRPRSRFCFRALRTLFAVDVIVNNLVLILPGAPSLPPPRKKEKGELSCNHGSLIPLRRVLEAAQRRGVLLGLQARCDRGVVPHLLLGCPAVSPAGPRGNDFTCCH